LEQKCDKIPKWQKRKFWDKIIKNKIFHGTTLVMEKPLYLEESFVLFSATIFQGNRVEEEEAQMKGNAVFTKIVE